MIIGENVAVAVSNVLIGILKKKDLFVNTEHVC